MARAVTRSHGAAYFVAMQDPAQLVEEALPTESRRRPQARVKGKTRAR
jgi:hypothetical protein